MSAIYTILIVLMMASIFLAACNSTDGDESGSIGVGDQAPDFRLKNQYGEEVTLAQYRGKKNVVLYFYPKDNTSGCTTQACTFRDRYEIFLESGAVVLGVSTDSVESHRDFASSYGLPFQLLSDEAGDLLSAYGVSSLFGMSERVTFVIDRQGVVRHVYASMFSPEDHIEEASKVLERLEMEYQESSG